MRVRGDVSPNVLDIEAHPTKPGFALVWLRENISEYTETDERGEVISGYKYDEYTIAVKFYSNLQHDIETNREEWVETLKNLEFDYNASVAVDMQDTIAELDAALLDAEYKNIIGEDINE